MKIDSKFTKILSFQNWYHISLAFLLLLKNSILNNAFRIVFRFTFSSHCPFLRLKTFLLVLERLHLTRPIHDYHFVSHAEITIDGVDDKEVLYFYT